MSFVNTCGCLNEFKATFGVTVALLFHDSLSLCLINFRSPS